MFNLPEHTMSCSGGFFVDIGEEDLFYVELENTMEYQELHKSQSSVLVKSTLVSGEKVTIRISWSKYKRVAQGKGYTGMRICEPLKYVPEMYSRDLRIVGSTYVEVSTREYIEGYPLSETWDSMDDLSKTKVMSQMENVVHDISRYTSSMFMKLQGKNLSTHSPVDFINYRIVLSMITNDLNKGDMRTLDMEDFEHTAVLCHNNLSMDHIIVSGDNITGIVGWSKCDYMPEVMSRMQYQFCKPVYEGESVWYNAMSRMDLFYPPPPPLYSTWCMYYNYYIRLRSTPIQYHEYLEKRLSEMSDVIIPYMREEYKCTVQTEQKSDSDHRSLSSHAEEKGTTAIPETSVEAPQQNCFDTASVSYTVDTWELSEEEGTILNLLDSMSVV
jgi:hypothetical protein